MKSGSGTPRDKIYSQFHGVQNTILQGLVYPSRFVASLLQLNALAALLCVDDLV